MSLLNYTAPQPLKGAYEGRLTSFKEIENEKGGYIELKFNVTNEEGSREYTHCLFPSSLDYFISAVGKQLETSERNLGALLELVKANPIEMFFTWNEEYQRLNVAFHKPTATEDIDVDDLVADLDSELGAL